MLLLRNFDAQLVEDEYLTDGMFYLGSNQAEVNEKGALQQNRDASFSILWYAYI